MLEPLKDVRTRDWSLSNNRTYDTDNQQHSANRGNYEKMPSKKTECKICGKECFYLGKHLLNEHSISSEDYYKRFIDTSVKTDCPICNKPNTFISLVYGFRKFCSLNCSNTQKVLELNADADFSRRKGQRIAKFNKLDSVRSKRRDKAIDRALLKGSRGFNSEYSDRIRNCENIVSRFGLVQPRYLYVIDVGNSIKLGSTNTLQRRMNSLGGELLFLLKGPTKDIAELERDTLIKFEKYTKLSEDKSFFTEFMESGIKLDLIDHLSNIALCSTTIEKLSIEEI